MPINKGPAEMAQHFAALRTQVAELTQKLKEAEDRATAAWELCAEIDLEVNGPSPDSPDWQAVNRLLSSVLLPPYDAENKTWKGQALAAAGEIATLRSCLEAAEAKAADLRHTLEQEQAAHDRCRVALEAALKAEWIASSSNSGADAAMDEFTSLMFGEGWEG